MFKPSGSELLVVRAIKSVRGRGNFAESIDCAHPIVRAKKTACLNAISLVTSLPNIGATLSIVKKTSFKRSGLLELLT